MTTGVGKSVTKFGPLLIGTGYTDEVDFGPQGAKAGGHVAGTTRHARDVTMTSRGQYRHGSLGAHPLRGTADLLIEHEVAHKNDLEAREVGECPVETLMRIVGGFIHGPDSTTRPSIQTH